MRHLLPADFVASSEASAGPWSAAEALGYTRWLARHHYENFHVVTFLLPACLHQDFFNVYAFCRWADDLGDEIPDRARSLELLNWWRGELRRMYAGEATHPVFIALRTTVNQHGIPEQPFADLIRAFVQDQTVTRYSTYEALLGYCVYSANPVGRLVLHLCGYTDEERRRLSDATCTALQLANFWQDVTRDLDKGRIYIPLEDMARHGYKVEDLERRRSNDAFCGLIRDLVDRTQVLFEAGLPLVDQVDRRLAVDLELFSRGGLAVLRKIRGQNYDVLARRPVLTTGDRLALLARALWRHVFKRTPPVRQHRVPAASGRI